MTNYIPHYTKKKQRREKLESEIKKLLDEWTEDSDTKKLRKLANEVKEARVRELRAKRDTYPPDGSVDLTGLDAKIAEAEATKPLDIILEFQESIYYRLAEKTND